ncbi:MAG: phosphotransferase [Tepidiformaceae bacterium]
MLFDIDSPDHPARLAAILSRAFDERVEIARVERLAPWAVARCYLATSGASVPPSVVVKWLRSDPNNYRTDPAQLLTECAALSFLDDLGLGVAPQVIGPAQAGIVVIEDLTPRQPLSDLLAGRAPGASEGLLAFARTLGGLHAGTAGRADAYYGRRVSLGPVDPQFERVRYFASGLDEAVAIADQLDIGMSTGAAQDAATLRQTLAEPGAFLALSNGDPGFNNFLVKGPDGRIIDFESAGYRHALSDAACLHVPNSIWLTVGDSIRDGSESEYRRALARAVPEAEDDHVFGLGLAAGCLAVAIERFSRFWKLDARVPGDESRLQLISTLEAACRAAEHHRSLPQLVGWLRSVTEFLRHRWPDADVDLASVEPFSPRRG